MTSKSKFEPTPRPLPSGPVANKAAIQITSQKSNARKVFYTISNKGGVGKTVLARALYDYLISRHLNAYAFDTDKQVGQLRQYFGSQVGTFDLRDEEEVRLIIDALSDFDRDYLLFDLPGGSLGNLRKIFNAADCMGIGEEVSRQGYELHILIPITPYIGSIQSVRDVMANFGETAHYHVFKQVSFLQGAVKTFDLWETFPLYEGGQTERDFAIERRANIFEMPELNANVLARLDLLNQPFTVATDVPPSLHWSNSQAANVRMWLRKVFPIFDLIV